jgi:NAD(P)-dependent dehydrogenase (short-subunit alcohol dehydrogenase family)
MLDTSSLVWSYAGDKSFKNMSDQEWDLVIAVHLKGAFAMSKACWPIMRGQKVRRLSFAQSFLRAKADRFVCLPL